ncbi:MAG: transposase, partial [Planctomycetota bacterium]|nr:transposase [Planctomycetota bacterium]
RKLFRLYHHAQSHPEADRGELTKAGERVCRILGRAPSKKTAENIAKRFRKHGDSYLRFLSHPLVEPTNNRAEQAIRQVVIDRAATQGTRSSKGRAYRERMWTVLSSCAKQHASAFTFILNSLFAHSSNTAPPSLL